MKVSPEERAARVWLRRLYTCPEGRDLVAMDSTRRRFTGMLRRMLVLRDDVCTTPWCEAPIVHADHTRPSRDGGRTSFTEGSGKCARCNHGKEAPGWRARVLLLPDHRDGRDNSGEAGARDREGNASGRSTGDGSALGAGDVVARRVVQLTTPHGHHYTSEPPPLLGWGSHTPRRHSAASATAADRDRAAAGPAHADLDADAGAEAGAGAGSDAEAEPRVGTDAEAEAEAERESGAGPVAGPEAKAEARARADADADAGPPGGSDADADAGGGVKGDAARRGEPPRRRGSVVPTSQGITDAPTRAGPRKRPRRRDGTEHRPMTRRPRLTSHLERQLCRYLS